MPDHSGDSVPKRYAWEALVTFAGELLHRAGLPQDRAAMTAELFVEADLLGYVTHGLRRLPINVEWLETGSTNATGDVTVERRSETSQVWDANFLPGPWVTARAVDAASEAAQRFGIGMISIRRSQHIACLAAQLTRAADRRMLILLCASTPSEAVVSAHGGVDRLFSCNPIAALIPTQETPILIDTSMSMSALGPLYWAHAGRNRLPVACIVNSDGSVTDDPDAFVAGDGAILPMGGIDQGYKGFALNLLTEALSAALAGAGRADGNEEGEANAVYVQGIDPDHFAGRSAFERQTSALAALSRSSRVAPGAPPVRVPGDRALALRENQLRTGVGLSSRIVSELRVCAEKYGVRLPPPLN